MHPITFPLPDPAKNQPKAVDPEVANLQEGLNLLLTAKKNPFGFDDATRQEALKGLELDLKNRRYGPATAGIVKQWRPTDESLKHDGTVDLATATSLNDALKALAEPVPTGKGTSPGGTGGTTTNPAGIGESPVTGPKPDDDGDRFFVTGTVRGPAGAGTGGLDIVVVDRSVAAEDTVLKDAQTENDGSYRLEFPAAVLAKLGKKLPDLQARVLVGGTTLGASAVRYNAPRRTVLDITLDTGASRRLPSEHETLTRDLGAVVGSRVKSLGELQETDERPDITHLARKTGWDARAVALAALADGFSDRSAEPDGSNRIAAAFFYALFRAGIPADENRLYQLPSGTLRSVLKRALENGVIPASLKSQLPGAIKRMRELGGSRLLSAPPLVGVSSFSSLLQRAKFSDADLGNFANLYTELRGNLEEFWGRVEKDFTKDIAQKLQVDGKLGFLTLNNAPLMEKLHAAVNASNGIADLVELAQAGFHRPGKWAEVLANQAEVPKEVPGESPEQQKSNYASYLAAQVRLAYPTASVAEMVQAGTLPLPGADADTVKAVHQFLTEHQDSFEIGVHPIRQFVQELKVEPVAGVVGHIQRLQRVYQITRGDEAMKVLLDKDLDSALAVVRYGPQAFVRDFTGPLGGEAAATRTYQSALQVHNAVLQISLGYLAARTATPIGTHSPTQILDPEPEGTEAIIANPTLEELFKSQDYCACAHCRSILSPAAYLVDLLHNLDQKAAKGGNPLDALLKRRPDIQHLPLTCENTNTALPYIDLVNETLEYYIAHDPAALSLTDYAGHDTAGSNSADLLARPQYVMDSAYAKLQRRIFPAPLPFHRPLEALRRYLAKSGLALPRAMEVLCRHDVLDVDRTGPKPPTESEFDWRDIWGEQLKLSRKEQELLTTSDPDPDTLADIYGFPPKTTDEEAIAELCNVRKFCRRCGVSYFEAVALLQTRFINPEVALLAPLQRLGVSFSDLQKLGADVPGITDDEFDQHLKDAGTVVDVADYGADPKKWEQGDKKFAPVIRQWLQAKEARDRMLRIMTVVDPTREAPDPKPFDFEQAEFRTSVPLPQANDPASRPKAPFFVRLLRFIRLWKKLGWTIQQTDAALAALWNDGTPPPPADLDDLAKLDAGLARLLPKLGIVARALELLALEPAAGALPLLACFAPIPACDGTEWYLDDEGARQSRLVPSLFRTLFLSPAVAKPDPAFASDTYGGFLSDPDAKLLEHAETLRAAGNLTAEEFAQIVTEEKFDANSPLSPPNVATVFRTGWLARQLQLSVREFLRLLACTKLDPFDLSDPTKPGLLQLVEFLRALKDRSLAVADALYLVWDQDLTGKAAPKAETFARLAAGLRRASAEENANDPLTRRQQAAAMVANAAGADPKFVLALLDPKKADSFHADGRKGVVALEDFLDLKEGSDEAAALATFGRTYKVSALAKSLGLSAGELAFFADPQRGTVVNADGWLNAVPVGDNTKPPADNALFKAFRELLELSRLRQALAPEAGRLSDALGQKDAVTAQKAKGALIVVTRWDPDALELVCAHFGIKSEELAQSKNLLRVGVALALVQATGAPAGALLSGVTNAPGPAAVQALLDGLRARYSADSWREFIRPINDELRAKSRDALVAFILHQMRVHKKTKHINTPEKLFEYFLMDVQMEPIMQTSRVRHALSAVQLFIERCLMNLEKGLQPSDLGELAQEWPWMRRYRVWEANRKVFLWPENWAESELRDQKSPFFKDLESALLQSDVTGDSAAAAYLDYLAQLEGVAKLEPCGMYHEEDADGNGIDHIVARSAGAHRKYYSCRHQGMAWTPWEPIKLEIEDDPVIPVIWKNRKFLFWLKLTKELPQTAAGAWPYPGESGSGGTGGGTGGGGGTVDPNEKLGNLTAKQLTHEMVAEVKTAVEKTTDTAAGQMTVKAILCWSEFYNGKWQPTKTSAVDAPRWVQTTSAGQFDRSILGLRAVTAQGNQDQLLVYLTKGGNGLVLHNTHSLPVPNDHAPEFTSLLGAFQDQPNRYPEDDSDHLMLCYAKPGSDTLYRTPLPNVPEPDYRAVEPQHRFGSSWGLPFLYADSRHTFYVTSRDEQVPMQKEIDIGVPVHPVIGQFYELPPLANNPATFHRPGGIGDPRAAASVLSEDALIVRGLSNRGTVQFGQARIGLSGAVAKPIRNL